MKKSTILSTIGLSVIVVTLGFIFLAPRNTAPVESDEPTTREDYLRLAERGNPAAQYMMAVELLTAENPSKEDVSEGIKWLVKAAHGNDADAQFNLGAMYAEGTHRPFVAKNIGDAIKWYHLAAENNHVEAQVNLALIYYYGVDGTPRNYEEAVKWFERAADQGDPKAQYLLGDCLYIGRGTKKDKTSAIELYRKSAQQGFAEASERLQSIRP